MFLPPVTVQLVCFCSITDSVVCLLRPERTSSACWGRTGPGQRLWRLTTAPRAPPNPCRPCRETDCCSATTAPKTCTRSPWPRWGRAHRRVSAGIRLTDWKTQWGVMKQQFHCYFCLDFSQIEDNHIQYIYCYCSTVISAIYITFKWRGSLKENE